MARVSLRRAASWTWLFLLMTATVVALVEGWLGWRDLRLASQIAAPDAIDVGESTPPELIFAKAHQLAASGQRDQASQLYASLTGVPDLGLRERALYNLGTLHLNEAARLWNARGVLEYARVNTLVAAAKEHLSAALRLNPENWDARFNLEYAYRITPPPRERPKSDFRGSKSSVFATLPAIPGGGP